MPQVDPEDGGPPVHYADMAEDCIEPQLVLDAGRLRRVVKVLWEDLERAMRGFLGFSQVRTTGGVRWLHRKTPDAYPRFLTLQGKPTLFCVGAGPAQGLRPQGQDADGTQGFVWAKLPLEYRTLPYEILPDNEVLGTAEPFGGLPDESSGLRYVYPHFDDAGRIMSLPQGMMQVANADARLRTPIRQGIPFRQAAGTLTVTHYLLPELPLATLAQAENRINSVEFFGYPAETLLLRGYRYRRQRSPLGDFVYQLDLIFDYLPNWSPVDGTAKGHNRILRRQNTVYVAVGPPAPGVLDYYLVTSDGTVDGTKAMFRQFDMTEVLRPDQ